MATLLRKYYNPWTVLLAIGIFLALYLSVLYPWMSRWGITDAEVSMPLPGDKTETGTVITSTRGTTIHAPANEVWSWLVQLGQDRAGFYSNDWLENLTLSDIHNSNEIHPEWQSRHLGDIVQGTGGIYGPGIGWHILHYEEGKELYLWGPIVVVPQDAQTSRLLVRTYAVPASFSAGILQQLTYGWMHFVMERGMLLGIKARAEHRLDSDLVLQTVSNIGWIVATLGMFLMLFMRRRGWWWGLIPLAYGAAILILTADLWSAMAGFLWFGVIAAGFLLFGRRWWKGLALAIALVILVFVLASQPHIAFGIIFLFIEMGYVGMRLMNKHQTISIGEAVRS
jgi:hypothetical protein